MGGGKRRFSQSKIFGLAQARISYSNESSSWLTQYLDESSKSVNSVGSSVNISQGFRNQSAIDVISINRANALLIASGINTSSLRIYQFQPATLDQGKFPGVSFLSSYDFQSWQLIVGFCWCPYTTGMPYKLFVGTSEGFIWALQVVVFATGVGKTSVLFKLNQKRISCLQDVQYAAHFPEDTIIVKTLLCPLLKIEPDGNQAAIVSVERITTVTVFLFHCFGKNNENTKSVLIGTTDGQVWINHEQQLRCLADFGNLESIVGLLQLSCIPFTIIVVGCRGTVEILCLSDQDASYSCGRKHGLLPCQIDAAELSSMSTHLYASSQGVILVYQIEASLPVCEENWNLRQVLRYAVVVDGIVDSIRVFSSMDVNEIDTVLLHSKNEHDETALIGFCVIQPNYCEMETSRNTLTNEEDECFVEGSTETYRNLVGLLSIRNTAIERNLKLVNTYFRQLKTFHALKNEKSPDCIVGHLEPISCGVHRADDSHPYTFFPVDLFRGNAFLRIKVPEELHPGGNNWRLLVQVTFPHFSVGRSIRCRTISIPLEEETGTVFDVPICVPSPMPIEVLVHAYISFQDDEKLLLPQFDLTKQIAERQLFPADFFEAGLDTTEMLRLFQLLNPASLGSTSSDGTKFIRAVCLKALLKGLKTTQVPEIWNIPIETARIVKIPISTRLLFTIGLRAACVSQNSTIPESVSLPLPLQTIWMWSAPALWEELLRLRTFVEDSKLVFVSYEKTPDRFPQNSVLLRACWEMYVKLRSTIY